MSKEKKKELLNCLIIVLVAFFAMIVINSITYAFADEGKFNIFNKIFRYDAYWYESIINDGYSMNQKPVTGGQNGMTNWAFFPLLPLIMKILDIFTFSVFSIPFLSFMFSTTCYVFFLYNIIQYLKEKNIKISYPILISVFVLNSIIMFFYTLYTESLTMLLIIFLLRVCERKKFLLSGFLCMLLTFVKVQGCVWCIYLFIKLFQECYKKESNVIKTFFSTVLNIMKNPVYLFSLAISPLGIMLFMLILYSSGLSPFAFFHVQAAWQKENGFFLFIILEGIVAGHINAFLAVFFLCFSGYLIKKKKYLNATIILIYILLACSSSVFSTSRYILGTVVFPFELYCVILNSFNRIKEIPANKNSIIKDLLIVDSYIVWKITTLILIVVFFISNTIILY